MCIESKCKQCSTDIAKNKTFCSSSCSAKYNNVRRKRKTYQDCLNCNTPLNKKASVYCSNKCQRAYEYKTVTLPRYYQGSVSCRGTLRSILNDLNGHVCVNCGIVDYNGMELVLEVNHIDGDPFNNVPSNLELLCPNCHSQTSTYKGRNRGNGRKLGSATE